MIDKDTRATLRAIEWEYKNDEWSGQLRKRIPNFDTIANIMACIRCPWRQSRKRFIASPGLDPTALIELVIANNQAPTLNANDYFPTPPAGAEELVNAIPRRGSFATMLEPSAGTGAIIAAAKTRWPEIQITAIESDPLSASILRYLHPDIEVIETDFLTWQTDRRFDVCVMNPPFSANGGYQAHIPKALSHLHPDRHLATLNTAGAIFKTKRCQPWRAWLAQHDAEIWPFNHQFDDTNAKIDGYLLQNTNPDWRRQPHDGYPNYPTAMLFMYLNNEYELNQKLEAWCKRLFTTHTYPQTATDELGQILRTTQERTTQTGQLIRYIDTWDIDTYDPATLTQLGTIAYTEYLRETQTIPATAIDDYLPPPTTLVTVEPAKHTRQPSRPALPPTPAPAPAPTPAPQLSFF